jgi:adenylate kinase
MAEIERAAVDTSAIKGIPIIWIMGGPGSGKGTQCDRLCVKYGYTHMSSGDLLRNEVLSGTARGRQLYALMADGKPVPNEYVNDLLAETMVKKAASKGFLIDGFPMDSEQADSFISDIGSPTAVILFEANDTILQERLKSRNNFDDTEESILKRIENYNQQTKPVADKFKAKIVNAERTADEIFPDVEAVMNGVK